MTNIYICDNCGKQITEWNELKKIPPLFNICAVDLCLDCATKLHNIRTKNNELLNQSMQEFINSHKNKLTLKEGKIVKKE